MNLDLERRRNACSDPGAYICPSCGVQHAPTPFDDVARDVILHILSYLSLKDVARLRSTSLHFFLVTTHMLYDRCFKLIEALDIPDDEVPGFFDLLEYHQAISSPLYARLEKKAKDGRILEVLILGTWKGKTVVGAVTELPSTLLMNFISGDGFHSLYPILTSGRKGILNLPLDVKLGGVGANAVSVPLLEDLQRGGFELIADPVDAVGQHCCGLHIDCPLAVRKFPGPPVFSVNFAPVRNCRGNGMSLPSPVVYVLRSGLACGRTPGDRPSQASHGFHMLVQGSETVQLPMEANLPLELLPTAN
ncbi:hypothetical protein FA13DRAFT_1711837 [Coprinellus micaceus]|uniref:Uncharacterized protein n=1 Tax=Coprinellus micaceus TaxID=71717 RepID=A0A4Y7T311_COPMI|nr:hypothetical protein FA13DRAFT_1711837 [Coprinellus micaceus]